MKFVEDILDQNKDFLLDASFFTIFKKDILKKIINPPILTPHTQEFISFFKEEASNLKNDTIRTVSKIAKKYNSYILLKDSFFTFSTPEGKTFIIEKQMRILAQAGSGDILSGLISGLLAQGYSKTESVFEGIRVFYNIAENLKDKNDKSYVANDFINNIELFK